MPAVRGNVFEHGLLQSNPAIPNKRYLYVESPENSSCKQRVKRSATVNVSKKDETLHDIKSAQTGKQ